MSMMDMKICGGKCGEEKNINCFRLKKNGLFDSWCLNCRSIYNKEYNKKYRITNKEKIKNEKKKYTIENKKDIKIYQKKYRKNNKNKKQQYQKIYYLNNKEEIKKNQKEYRKNNKNSINKKNKKFYNDNRDHIRYYQKEYVKNKIKNNIFFKLHMNISSKIRNILNKNKSNKNRKSFIKYIPYTVEELYIHLESQFEPWMTRDNQGVYRIKDWDDNNPSTWRWQIDHIIPQSDLPYKSMEDDNFKKSWDLSNLRPYSAKQNLLDGVNRVRHKRYGI